MGRVKGRHIKAAAKELTDRFPGQFSTDFEANKVKIKEMGILPESKKEQKKLAGEVAVYLKRLNRSK